MGISTHCTSLDSSKKPNKNLTGSAKTPQRATRGLASVQPSQDSGDVPQYDDFVAEIKVLGQRNCDEAPDNKCLIIRHGSRLFSYPHKIDDFSYESGKYVLRVFFQQGSDEQGDYVLYKWLDTIDHQAKTQDRKENCNILPLSMGLCRMGMTIHAFFEPETQQCVEYEISVCGRFIPFSSLKACQKYCEN